MSESIVDFILHYKKSIEKNCEDRERVSKQIALRWPSDKFLLRWLFGFSAGYAKFKTRFIIEWNS